MSISFLESLIIRCAPKYLVFLWNWIKYLSSSENGIVMIFYKNVIITSRHKEYLTESVKIKLISVDIFTESFVKFVEKLWEIYGKNKYITFFLNTVYMFSVYISNNSSFSLLFLFNQVMSLQLVNQRLLQCSAYAIATYSLANTTVEMLTSRCFSFSTLSWHNRKRVRYATISRMRLWSVTHNKHDNHHTQASLW